MYYIKIVLSCKFTVCIICE